MFRKKTLLVMGAGASWHYGYPTGAELVSEVRDLARALQRYYNKRMNWGFNLGHMPRFMCGGENKGNVVHVGLENQFVKNIWREEIKLLDQFITRLENSAPLVIDSFLGWNPHFARLGRMLIAGALLKREADSNESSSTKEKIGASWARERWVRHIVHKLLMPHPDEAFGLLKNEISFVTFNYDLSLERELRRALSSTETVTVAEIDAFFEDDRILHMYGKLQSVQPNLNFSILDKAFDSPYATDALHEANELLDAWEVSSRLLKVIDQVDKHDDLISQIAQNRTRSADTLYFLGFGFDESNLRRLGFPKKPEMRPPHQQGIYFTNYHNQMSVNRYVTKAFGVDMRIEPMGAGEGLLIEKSEKNVADAIALDFGGFAE
jgi:hypothetical protein